MCQKVHPSRKHHPKIPRRQLVPPTQSPAYPVSPAAQKTPIPSHRPSTSLPSPCLGVCQTQTQKVKTVSESTKVPLQQKPLPSKRNPSPILKAIRENAKLSPQWNAHPSGKDPWPMKLRLCLTTIRWNPAHQKPRNITQATAPYSSISAMTAGLCSVPMQRTNRTKQKPRKLP